MKNGLVLMLFLCAAFIQAKDVEILAFEYPPLHGENAVSREGIIPEMVRAAFAASGVSTTLKFVPTGRGIAQVKSGESLMFIGLMEYFDAEARTYLTGFPMMVVDFYVFYMEDRFPQGLRYTGTDDLRPYKIGVMLNGTTDIFSRRMGLTVEQAPNLELVFEKLVHGRSDVCISNDLSGFHLIHKLFPKEENHFRFCREKPFLSQISTAIFNQHHGDYAEMAPKFHEGLRKIMQDGTWLRIVSRYYPDGKVPESSLRMVRDYLATDRYPEPARQPQ